MFKTRKIIALCCAVMLTFSMTTSTFAYGGEGIRLDSESTVTYEELPEHIRHCVKNGDLVIFEDDEYYVFRKNEGSNIQTRATNGLRYDPDGGTYTYFEDMILEESTWYTTYLLGMSYIPGGYVAGYLIDGFKTGFLEQVYDVLIASGESAAIEFIFAETAWAVPAAVCVYIEQLHEIYIRYARYNAVKQAYLKYVDGEEDCGLITTMTYEHDKSTGYGNIVTTFEQWDGFYVEKQPYGRDATWRSEEYWAGAEAPL